MFGGYGIYLDETIFAIIVDNVLYLKTDSTTCERFIKKGLRPFTYTARGRRVAMKYYEAPSEIFEDIEALQSWGKEAIGVALKAKKKTPNKKPQN